MEKQMKKLLAATALLTALTGMACAKDLIVGAANVSDGLDPGKDHSNVGSQFYMNASDPLIARDVTTTDQKWLPGLATEWKMVDDKTMDLTLRQGVTFQNGEPMTADDVVFSLNRMFQATFPPYQVRAKDRFQNFVGAEKVDDFTVRVTAKRADPLFETLLNLQQVFIIPMDYTMALSGDPKVAEDSDYEAFALAPVGTGPYKITELNPGQKVVYERFDGFWGDKAPLDKVTVLRIPEISARLTALKTGEVDMITNVAPDQLALLEGDAAVKVVGAPTALFHVMILNANNPKLKDACIRQALSLAIDRDALNEALWFGKAIVPSTHTYKEYGPMYQPELTTFRYDPEKAKALLAEAGYDGFEVTFDSDPVYYTNGALAAQAIMEMWAAVGIKGKLNLDGKWTGGEPSMMARNWSNPMYFADPVGSFGVMWAPGGPSEGEGRFNVTPEYTANWEEFRFAPTVEARKASFAKLMDYIQAEAPVLPLYQPYESWAMKSNVTWAPLPGNVPYALDFRAGNITVE
jgi:peptide/nickel transport system substrate-binding protein